MDPNEFLIPEAYNLYTHFFPKYEAYGYMGTQEMYEYARNNDIPTECVSKIASLVRRTHKPPVFFANRTLASRYANYRTTETEEQHVIYRFNDKWLVRNKVTRQVLDSTGRVLDHTLKDY